MKKYCEMSREELLDLKKELDREFDEIKAEGLALDMSRGKPSAAQLDLSMGMMDGTEQHDRFEMLRWRRLPELRCAGRYSGGKRASG